MEIVILTVSQISLYPESDEGGVYDHGAQKLHSGNVKLVTTI